MYAQTNSSIPFGGYSHDKDVRWHRPLGLFALRRIVLNIHVVNSARLSGQNAVTVPLILYFSC